MFQGQTGRLGLVNFGRWASVPWCTSSNKTVSLFSLSARLAARSMAGCECGLKAIMLHYSGDILNRFDRAQKGNLDVGIVGTLHLRNPGI